MGCMSDTATSTPEQLSLIDAAEVPLQLRLDERTRRLGLAGVAMARALLAEQQARRAAAEQATRTARKRPLPRPAVSAPRAA